MDFTDSIFYLQSHSFLLEQIWCISTAIRRLLNWVKYLANKDYFKTIQLSQKTRNSTNQILCNFAILIEI